MDEKRIWMMTLPSRGESNLLRGVALLAQKQRQTANLMLLQFAMALALGAYWSALIGNVHLFDGHLLRVGSHVIT